jgi:hypothetical protein
MNDKPEPDKQEIAWPPPKSDPGYEPTEPWAKQAARKKGEELVEWEEWQKWR